MATHEQNIENLRTAIYGEQVRGSLIQLFEEDYTLVKNGIGVGTDITSASSSTSGYVDGNIYINSNTLDIWKTDGTTWQHAGNLKGIRSIVTVPSTEDSGNNVVTITTTDGRTESFNVKNGRGIKTICVTESSVDGENNVVEITLSDNLKKSFNVKNGKTGEQGVSVVDAVDKGNGTFALALSDGTETPSTVKTIQGLQGIKGDKGETGDAGDPGRGVSNIKSIDAGRNHTIVAEYTDSTSQVVATIKDGADGEGTGDMRKETYDTDDDGIVNSAQSLVDVENKKTYPASIIGQKADKATTLTGYGISDAYTKTQVDVKLDDKVDAPKSEGQAGNALLTDGNGNRYWGEVAADQYVKSVEVTQFAVDSDGKLALAESAKTSLGMFDPKKRYVGGNRVYYEGGHYELKEGHEVTGIVPTVAYDWINLDAEVTEKLAPLDFDSETDKDKVLKVKSDGSGLEWGNGGSDIEEPTELEKGIVGGDEYVSGTHNKDYICIKDNIIYRCKKNAVTSIPSETSVLSGEWEVISLGQIKTELSKDDLGEYVDILSYNSKTNCYTFPCDGFVRLYSANENTKIYTDVIGSQNMSIYFRITAVGSPATFEGSHALYNSAFVKKGMKCFNVKSGSGNATAVFIPIV